jgi:glycosyltransferase involved in cell wall biosynthesis
LVEIATPDKKECPFVKILIAGQAFFQHNNGQAVFTINLAQGLAAAGHSVTVLAPSETGRAYHAEQDGVMKLAVSSLPLKYNANITAFCDRRVAQLIAAFAPDVLHIQDHYFLSRSALHSARQHPITCVGTNHFLPENIIDNLRLPGLLRPPIERVLWRTMLDVYNRLDGVTTPTETGVNILKRAGLRVPVQAISCGVDRWRFRPRPELNRTALRRKYGLAADKILLLFVGRVDHEKCLDTVIHALGMLDRDDVQFAIAGAGSHIHALQALCQDLALGERVVFTGFVPDRDLPLLLNSADAFVMPGHAELQSIATLEAMASGLPVLAANARALPELVTPDVNGYLFTPDDSADVVRSIATLLHNRQRWPGMGAASLDKVAIHAQQNTIQRYLDWYRQVRLADQVVHRLQPALQG